jgi:hypothetical protein
VGFHHQALDIQDVMWYYAVTPSECERPLKPTDEDGAISVPPFCLVSRFF